VRLGQQIDFEHANPVVTKMVDSIFRNQDALLALTRIRQVGRYTFEHSVNVAVLMVSFARAMGLEQALIHDIGLGALLHDIGKTLVPPEILNKPGALTDDEFVVMRGHVVHTNNILTVVPGIPQIALSVAAEHHERIDGNGYPNRKMGADISLYGQMASVADVYDATGKFITTMFFKGNFPQSFVLENMPSKAGKLVFKNSNPAFKPIATLQISNLCGGTYDVNVELASGNVQYQVILKALCPDNLLMAIAPTYSAEVRLKNSDELWQGIQMKGGVIDLPGKPDNDYEIRLLWKDKWEYSTYSTKFDADGNYLGIPETDATIVSKRLADGRIQLSVEKIFEQNICDDLGW